MESLLLIALLFFVGLSIYFFWRSLQSVGQAKYESVVGERQQLQLLLAKSQQREESLTMDVQQLRQSYERERQERQAVERTLESTTAYLQAQQDRFQEQKTEMKNIREQFNQDFQVMASRILEEKTLKFTRLNQENLGSLLSPLQEKIKSFEHKVEQAYQQESAERHVLKGVVEQLMKQSEHIQAEAHNLTKALKGDAKKQGNWGEVILERVLERSGLVKDQEYRLQASMINGEGRRLQPDAIIDLPDDKHLVVDAKMSLVAYERWVNAEEDGERALFLKQHVLSVENHVKELSAKNYNALYGIQSPDFVLLFMPIESALSAAVMAQPELFSEAWDRRVVIVSPSTLLATLRTIASMWKQERQNRNVLEIAREAGALYDKFVGFLTDMNHIQTYLHKATEKHEDAMRKLNSGTGNVIRKVEHLKTLGAKASKQIDAKYLGD